MSLYIYVNTYVYLYMSIYICAWDNWLVLVARGPPFYNLLVTCYKEEEEEIIVINLRGVSFACQWL
jgi:sortase (surface protein transpeptidase)